MAYDLTQPESAAETYLAKLTGDYSGELPDPITRIDFYLKKLVASGGTSGGGGGSGIEVDPTLTKSGQAADAAVTGEKFNNSVGKKTSDGGEIFNDYAHNVASGQDSHAEGWGTTASGQDSHAEGSRTTASGDFSHAEGQDTIAYGEKSHAEGSETTAGIKPTDDNPNPKQPIGAHAEGSKTTASDECSHAEGIGTTASGTWSHAEGAGTIASGMSSHAEGAGTIASGPISHAEGSGTKASSENQHVQGKYNIEDTASKYAFIIGNGKDNDNRSNAFAVDWNGNIFCDKDTTSLNAQIKSKAESAELANYLPLSGGMVSNSGYGEQLKINRTDATSDVQVSAIDYLFDGERVGVAGFYKNGTFIVRDAHTLNMVEIRGNGDGAFAGSVTAKSFNGTATSATKLQTARTINGVPFDGSENVNIPL